MAISLGRWWYPSQKIVINLIWTYEKLHCKWEPNRFNSWWDPLVLRDRQTNILLLLYNDKSWRAITRQFQIFVYSQSNSQIVSHMSRTKIGLSCKLKCLVGFILSIEIARFKFKYLLNFQSTSQLAGHMFKIKISGITKISNMPLLPSNICYFSGA